MVGGVIFTGSLWPVTCIGWIIQRQVLHSQLCLRMRNQGTPRLRFKDVAKRNVNRRDIDLNRCQVSANDRSNYDEP